MSIWRFIGCASLGSLFGLAGTGPALGQVALADQIGTNITNVEIAIKTLREGMSTAISQHRTFEEKYKDAEVLFLLEDFGTASLLLFELADEPEYAQREEQGRILYYLAEAQYQLRNFKTSKEYFLRLMKYLAGRDTPDVSKLKFAVMRVTAIAEEQNDWKGIDEAVQAFRAAYSGAPPPLVVYLDAKSHLRQKRLGKVEQMLQSVPTDHPIYHKCRYLAAVEAVEMERWDDAKRIFNEVSQIEGDYDDLNTVRELAVMNEARLYGETKRFSEAVAIYQKIPRTSPFFSEALFEATWAYVNAAALFDKEIERAVFFERARKSLEIMLLSEQDTYLGPEARLLYGNILLRLAKYDRAQVAFGEMVRRYQPVREELGKLVANAQDPERYYDELLDKRREGTSALPPMVIKWAEREENLQGALEVVEDLSLSESWLAESNEVSERLNQAIEQNKGPRLLAAFREWESRLNRQDDALAKFDEALLAVLQEKVVPSLSAEDRNALSRLQKERETLAEARHKLLSGDEAEEALKKLSARRRQLFEMGWEIEGMNRTALALVKWLDDNGKKLTARDLGQYQQMLSQARREVDQLTEDKELLRREIGKLESKFKNQSESVSNAFYDDLFASLDVEFRFLKSRARGLDGALLTALEREHRRAAALHDDLDVLKADLAKRAIARANAIRKSIKAEQENILGFANNVNSMRYQARSAVGGIALSSLRRVEEQFYEIVLRGDVGMVDVAWSAKERETREINQRVSEQKLNLKILDQEYQDIMQGSDDL